MSNTITVTNLLVNVEALENQAQIDLANCDTSVTSQVEGVMTAFADYKNEIYAAAGGSRTDTAKTVTPAGTSLQQEQSLGLILNLGAGIETQPVYNLSLGAGASSSFGASYSLLNSRQTLIAAVWALYVAQYNAL